MELNNIIDYILSNPTTYPGLHQESFPRTSSSFKPLEKKSQLQIIWRSFCEYLYEKLSECKGINIKNFGAFTYEVQTELPKLGINYNKAKNMSFKELLTEKKTIHKLKPCFIIDNKFKKILSKFNDKEELTKPKSQSNIYQKGFQMIYCNMVPIAAACYLHKNVVSDAINSIFSAVYDLVNSGKNVVLKFSFCNVYFYDRNLKFTFSQNFNSTFSNYVETQDKLRRGITPISNNWKISKFEKWEKSRLSVLLQRPPSPLIKAIDEKNEMLRIMSYDLASTAINTVRK